MGNTPNIRFKGFTDDWEQRKFPEFVSFYNGLTYTPNDIQEMGTLVLRSSNVKNGEIVDADNVYVNDKVATSENVQVGDIIVVVRNGSRALIGKHAQIKASMPNTVIGAFMSGIRSGQSSFVNALLDTSAFENEIAKNMGATINQITGYMFSKMEFMVPSEEEQQQIGQYFSNLDHLITLHQRKCDETKKLKKFMLQKMFPKKNEKKPEIRFAGFTDDWEQRKLIDYLEVSSEKNRDNRFTKDDVLSVSGEYGIVNQIEFQGRSFAGASVSNYGVVENGDVVYTKSPLKSNPYGIIKTNKGIPGIVSTLYAVYKPKEITDSKFVQIYFELDSRMNSYMHPLVNKGAKNDMKVSAENALKGMVSFPKKDEQEMISLYFSSLDNLIALHQRKCDEIKEIKKFMLQNMFPQKG
jgi:type I restriction-modification system specificity subunit